MARQHANKLIMINFNLIGLREQVLNTFQKK